MRHLIVTNLQNFERSKLVVDSKQVDEFKVARGYLLNVLQFEVIYDQLVESHWDYKNKVNYWNLRSITKPSADYILNHEIRSSLNRLAFNLLNLSKLYLDMHFNADKKKCFAFDLTSDTGAENQIIKQRESIYSSNLDYVIGCKLRSHSQHSSLPVSTFTTNMNFDQSSKESTVNFHINYSYNDLIKIGVPKNRIDKDKKLDLTKIIDGYVFAISQMHALNRDHIGPVVDKSRTLILEMWSDEIKDVGYQKYDCEIEVSENSYTNTTLDWFSVYDHLKAKHSFSVNYSKVILGK
jgi:hypothetical protein